MIHFVLDGHTFVNEVQTIIQVFYPNQKYKQAEAPGEGLTVVSRLCGGACRGAVYRDGELLAAAESPWRERADVKRPLYRVLRQLTGFDPPWGMLTGIRPAKKMTELLESQTPEACLARFTEDFDVKPEKAELALSVAQTEREVLARYGADGVSLYIGIPFCPTRCLYCSFPSYPLEKFGGQVEGYLAALEQELVYFSHLLAGQPLRTIYIGGGTPTALSEKQLDGLLGRIAKLFPVEGLLEYTVEAGRPDTITAEKLAVLKAHGVSRISINPQTMNDRTLVTIGRRHTVADVERAYGLARAAGHQNINMDLILGLPGEGVAEAAHTLERMRELAPESLTVHTLAIKRASRLNEQLEDYPLPSPADMEQMLRLSRETAAALGMRPYYMYRQKNMVGSYENVGYARPGLESPYNILIMEESQTIYAAGCGAVTKVVTPERIDRVFNVKSLEDYMGRIDEMIARKRDFFGR